MAAAPDGRTRLRDAVLPRLESADGPDDAPWCCCIAAGFWRGARVAAPPPRDEARSDAADRPGAAARPRRAASAASTCLIAAGIAALAATAAARRRVGSHDSAAEPGCMRASPSLSESAPGRYSSSAPCRPPPCSVKGEDARRFLARFPPAVALAPTDVLGALPLVPIGPALLTSTTEAFRTADAAAALGSAAMAAGGMPVRRARACGLRPDAAAASWRSWLIVVPDARVTTFDPPSHLNLMRIDIAPASSAPRGGQADVPGGLLAACAPSCARSAWNTCAPRNIPARPASASAGKGVARSPWSRCGVSTMGLAKPHLRWQQ